MLNEWIWNALDMREKRIDLLQLNDDVNQQASPHIKGPRVSTDGTGRY